MHRRNPRASPLLLSAAFVLVAGRLSADEAPAAGVKAKAGAKGSPLAPGEFTIEWDKLQLGEPDIIKRLYRLRKSNQWEEDRLPRMVRLVIESGRPKLLPYGHYYQALIHGRNGEKDLALESIRKAIDLGYANYVEIAGAEELASLQDMEEFRALVEPLAGAFRKKVRETFEARVDAEIAASADAGGDRWAPGLESRPEGGPFWREGSPAVAVITRIDHEGFEKLLPRIKKLVEGQGEEIAAGVVFYREFPGDEARIARTDAYARRLGLEKIRHAVAGRDEYKAIVAALIALHEKARAVRAEGKKGKGAEEESAAEESAPFHVYPLITAFFDRRGALRHGACGVLEDWQLEYAARKLLEASPPAEAPPEEAKKEEPPPQEESPAPEEKPPGEEKAVEKEDPAKEEPQPDKEQKEEGEGEPPPPEDPPQEKPAKEEPQPEEPPPPEEGSDEP